MWNEEEFAVKNDSQVFVVIKNWYFAMISFQYWVYVKLKLVAEVVAFHFYFWKF